MSLRQSLSGTPTVLIVDDDGSFRFLTGEALEQNGFRVIEADDGDVALERFQEQLPDIVLLDVMMPRLDGYATCEKLRELSYGHHVPILMLTGREDPESIERAYEVGATDFLTKPPNYLLLARRLWYVLRASCYFAHFDQLTGLPGRMLLSEMMRHTMAAAKRHERPLAVVYIDIDGFGCINESIGPAAGDQVLWQIATGLRHSLRLDDLVGRIGPTGSDDAGDSVKIPSLSRVGGDKFVLVLTDLNDAADLRGILKRIEEVFATSITIGDEHLVVRASIGISLYPVDAANWDELLANAQAAARDAKRQGGDRYRYFSGELNERSRRRFSVERELRQAFARNELEVKYQPKILLSTGEVAGVEALLRWNNPRLGSVPPFELVEVAEQTGLITPIGEWVLETACRDLRGWQQLGFDNLCVAVNVSPTQLRAPDIVKTVATIIDRSAVMPGQIELELTEGILIQCVDDDDGLLDTLKTIGVQLAVDDFGTGYSSLSYLERFPVNKLKLDRSFLQRLTKRTQSAAIVNAIVNLGHSLGLKVVAEGVETEEQLTFLRAYRCDEGQGFLFARALPSDELVAFIQQRRALAGGADHALLERGKRSA